MDLSLLVLAAGMGSRYGGLKQIDPVGPNGEIIIDYSIFDALRSGFNQIVFVIRKDIEAPFREKIGSRFEKHADVKYVYQELENLPEGMNVPQDRTKPWGTAHAVMVAQKAVTNPFAVINADDFYGRPGFAVLGKYLGGLPDPSNTDFSMVGFTLRSTLSDAGSVARGVCHSGPDGFLESIVELTNIEKKGNGAQYVDSSGKAIALSGDEIVSMNMWGFTPALFAMLDRLFQDFLDSRGNDLKAEFFISSALHNLIEEGAARVKVLETPSSAAGSESQWFGLTYKSDHTIALKAMQSMIDAGEYPKGLWG